MTDAEIRKLCNELEDRYPEGGCVSRASIFNRALNDGLITEDIRNEARDFYGSLWTYTGD